MQDRYVPARVFIDHRTIGTATGRDHEAEELGVAKGLVIGISLSAGFWLGLLALVWCIAD